jgi:hypothetical protein
MPLDPISRHHYENIVNDTTATAEDGKRQTVFTTTVEYDGKTYLIPQVWDGEVVSPKEAEKRAFESGVYKEFDSREEADAFDKQIHEKMTGTTTKDEALSALVNDAKGEYAEGGSVKKDPVSGNEVPKGALPKEVRDDVPAMLSEGEFVIPADVVRYIGLDKLMKMRDSAKQGLEKMDAEGQIGGEPTSTDEEMEALQFATGGTVPAAAITTDTQPLTQTNVLQSSQVTPVRPEEPLVPDADYFQTNLGQTGATNSSRIGSAVYIGPNGERITLRTVDGIPTQEIPPGYVPEDQAVKGEDGTVKAPGAEVATGTQAQVCPVGTKWNPETQQCESIYSSDGGEQQETPTPEIDNRIALAKLFAEDDPKVAAALKQYEEGKIGIKDVLGIFSGLSGLVSLIGKASAAGDNKKALIEAVMASQETGGKTGDGRTAYTAEGELLRDWSNSTRSEKETMEIVEKAMKGGASRALAVAMAVDDTYDKDVDVSNISKFEDTIAEKYGVSKGSTQAAILAKQELDLFDGNLTAALEFQYGAEDDDTQVSTGNIGKIMGLEDTMSQSAISGALQDVGGLTNLSNQYSSDSSGTDSFFSDMGSVSTSDRYGTTAGSQQSEMLAAQDADFFSDNDDSGSGGGGGGGGGGSSRWCCSAMVHAGLWTEKREFARMTLWSMRKFGPEHSWWLRGYNHWGKWVAKNIVTKYGWGKTLMQAFYDYHVEGKPYTAKTLLAQAIIFPGAFIAGHVHAKDALPTNARLATMEELS